MVWDWLTRKKHLQTLRVSFVEFCGEKDGLPEQDLKRELTTLFHDRADVAEAYLALIRYPGQSDLGVALCLIGVAATAHAEIVASISRIFEIMFRRDMHLDILFPTALDLMKLEKVCRPFFVRDTDPIG